MPVVGLWGRRRPGCIYHESQLPVLLPTGDVYIGWESVQACLQCVKMTVDNGGMRETFFVILTVEPSSRSAYPPQLYACAGV